MPDMKQVLIEEQLECSTHEKSVSVIYQDFVFWHCKKIALHFFLQGTNPYIDHTLL